MSFSGFSAETHTFFSNLVHNNNKAWFQENKAIYEQAVLSPAKAFVTAFGEQLTTIQPNTQFDTRTNGGGSFFRIYRDTRFSRDKTPYKTFLSAMLWLGDNTKKMENPGFYIRIDEHGVELYAGMYGLPKEMLTAYREKVDVETTGIALQAIVESLSAANYESMGERYKRIPGGFDKTHPRATLLLNKGLFFKAPTAPRHVVHSAELVDWALEHATKMAPLNQWFATLTGVM